MFSGTLLPGQSHHALKIVSNLSLRNPSARKQLSREITLHKSLRHVNIVKFERFFHDSDYCYIVMELCELNVSRSTANCSIYSYSEELMYTHTKIPFHFCSQCPNY